MMNKTYRYIIAVNAVVLFGFVAGTSDLFFQMAKSIDIFGRVYKEVTLNYVDNVNPEEFMLSGIKGMLGNLDPYTVFIDETMKKDIDLMTTGKYGGIGVSVGIRDDKVTIIDLLEGYSAQRQGIRIGDVITRVDDTEITKENYNSLSEYLKGKPGEIVKVSIYRDGTGEELIFNLVLEEITVKNLTYYGFIPEESNNVYLKLSSFSRSAGEEIKKAIVELKRSREVKSIVLDLRGNPGGLLDQAVDVAEKFLKKNDVIVSVIGRDTMNINTYYSKEEPVAGDARLIVLVDANTASASEIVAGAVQDHDRGVIIGEPTFGKGLVQTVVPLSYNTSLKITTARYYTPSGRSIQKVDYANNNKVVQKISGNAAKEFSTDNKRIVLPSGGIKPDTLLKNQSESKQVQTLMARGMFFKFATNYFNQNPEVSSDDSKTDEYYDKFIEYLIQQDFEYTSKTEKLLNELKEQAGADKIGNGIIERLNELSDRFNELKVKELSIYKDDIAAEIMKEIADRTEGRDGRIKESLKHDKQFKLALKILNEGNSYALLLTPGEQ